MRDLQLPGRSTVHAARGLCATSSPLAAQAAIRVLQEGGNAADAAITGALLLGLCEPGSTGIGGDAFVLIRPAPGEPIRALNGSGRAPAGFDAAAARAKGDRIDLHHTNAVTLPGAIDAFVALSEEYGRIGLEDALAPVIRYAEEGVPIGPRVAFDYASAGGVLSGDAERHYLFSGANPKPGDLFRAPGQAEILRRVAKEGRSGFYEGEVAQDMVDSLQALGGTHTLDDFAATMGSADWSDPIAGGYRGAMLHEHPPNGQGATALLMAAILERLEAHRLDPFGAQRVHLEAEAAKLAYDARDRFIADPGHTRRLDHMLDPATADALAALIDPKRAMTDPRMLSGAVHRDTVYLSVVDEDRMAVSMIYSIFHGFGSGLASEKFGVLFQNRGGGFTLEEGHPNEAAPGKRPMHTIIPAMLEQGGTLAPFGVMGGQYQPAGHVRVMSNIVDHGMDPQEALDCPRSFPDPETGRLDVERGYPDSVRAELAEMGHEVAIPATPIGGAQMVRIEENGTLTGASEPRKDGLAIGY